jgi:phospholipid/cholesterol/gamma-HCH transport system ATP-binding protein
MNSSDTPNTDSGCDVGDRPAVAVNRLQARYSDTVILKEVSFVVNRGEILTILGGSGCGKSTLMRHLIGLRPPYSGTIEINGSDITRCSESRLHEILRGIGVLFQGSALFSAMTVAENVALPIREYTDLLPEDIDQLVRMKLCQVDLNGYENYMPAELSGGMRKRAGLARAMALTPPILCLDEPSAGLDPATTAEIDELIIRLNRELKTTFVIVTHELHSILRISHRCILLDKASRGIVAQGDPRKLQTRDPQPAVQRFFNPEMGLAKD